MGTKILILFILLLSMCFCIYNWWFLRENYKRTPNILKGKQPLMKNHVFWGITSLVLLAAIITITSIELYNLIINIMKMQD